MASYPRTMYKRRATITAMPLYHSGHLLKKHSNEKDFKRYFAELRGSVIFLYTDDAQTTYAEKLELQGLKLLERYEINMHVVYTLYLHNEDVQFKFENSLTGEEWRGLILTVATKHIPNNLCLLPGQKIKLEEVLAQEQERQAPLSSSPPPSSHPPLPPRPAVVPPVNIKTRPPTANPAHQVSQVDSSPRNTHAGSLSDMPPCFFPVTREKAEQMLIEHPQYGSIILRPSAQANAYALTLRQVNSSGPVMKNYKLTTTDAGFLIELDTPVTVPSLSDALTYFLEQTEHRLRAYVEPQLYDTRIELPPTQTTASVPSTASKAVPKALVSPRVDARTMQDNAKAIENDYVEPDDTMGRKTKQDKPKKEPRNFDEDLRVALKQRREHIYKMS